MEERLIGNYRVLEQKGEGGMAKVYLAVHKDVPNLKVVLKILSDPRMVDRFKSEADNLAKLDGHPNICRIKHFFSHGDETVIAMEYIDGQALDEMHLPSAQMPVAEAVRITAEVLDILSFAHLNHVYHRDIKPGNIMLDRSGQPKVIDFGIAKADNDPNLTAAGSCCGTPSYMSPEQFTPTEDTNYVLVDIYAVGTTLYWLLTGEVPFKGDNEFAIRDAKLFNDPPSPRKLNGSISKQLNKIILKALAKDPKKRFGSTEAMRDALLACGTGKVKETPVSDGATVAMTPADPVPKPERNWKMIIGAASTLVAVAAVVGWIYWPSEPRVEPMGWAEIELTPAADSVFFDDSLVARRASAVSIDGTVGQHRLRLFKTGASNSPIVETVTLTANLTEQLSYEFIMPEVGTVPTATGLVRVDVSPAADSIFFDGNLIARGKTTVTTEGTVGEHQIRLVNNQATNSPLTRSVTISADQTERVRYSFRIPPPDSDPDPGSPPPSAFGDIFAGSDPRGASIFIDGVEKGEHTPHWFKVSPGRHVVRLKRGFQTRDTIVTVMGADSHWVNLEFDN